MMILEESGSPTLTGKPGNSMFEMKNFIVIWNILVRCQCGNCVMMPTPEESVCCQEIDAISNKICSFTPESDIESTPIHCITEHEGFEAVCLNPWVLQAGFYSYRQHYGTRDIRDIPQNE